MRAAARTPFGRAAIRFGLAPVHGLAACRGHQQADEHTERPTCHDDVRTIPLLVSLGNQF